MSIFTVHINKFVLERTWLWREQAALYEMWVNRIEKVGQWGWQRNGRVCTSVVLYRHGVLTSNFEVCLHTPAAFSRHLKYSENEPKIIFWTIDFKIPIFLSKYYISYHNISLDLWLWLQYHHLEAKNKRQDALYNWAGCLWDNLRSPYSLHQFLVWFSYRTLLD